MLVSAFRQSIFSLGLSTFKTFKSCADFDEKASKAYINKFKKSCLLKAKMHLQVNDKDIEVCL
jgi:hypothetical protein